MYRNALQILGQVARHGEMPLNEALRMSHKRGSDHRSQYSVALLLEEHHGHGNEHGHGNRMGRRRRR